MGILDGIVEWIAEQVMNILDLITTSVLAALGCSMDTFLRYFPAAETMYQIFLALAIGLILLNWVWQLFKNYFMGTGIDAEDPIKLSLRTFMFLFLTFYAKDIVDLLLNIAGTPYSWILTEDLPPLEFAKFNSVITVILGVCANGAVAIVALILVLILAWNYIKLLFEAIYFPGIGTTAKNKADGDQEAVATKEVTIIDTVSYQNLIPDTPYKLVGTLMDKTTQKEVMIDGKPVTAETEFTPKDSNGSVEVIFTFDGSTLAGHDVVVFEKLFSLEGETALEIASHEDLDDKGQTIKLTEVPKDTPEPSKPVKTGDETTILPYLLLAGAALLFAAGFGILYIRKRKKDK